MAFTQVHYLPPSTYILAMIVRNATSAIDARIIASLKFAFFCSGVMVVTLIDSLDNEISAGRHLPKQ